MPVGFGSNSLPYYRDTSLERKLLCPAIGNLTVRSSLVAVQFGDILRSIELPATWREAIVEKCQAANSDGDAESERVRRRRVELDSEQKRLIALFRKGSITELDLDEQMEQIRTELFRLPMPVTRDTKKTTQEALSAGETLERMADYWSEAIAEERRDMVWSLLNAEGVIYDLERHVIVGLKPRAGVLSVLALGLEATSMWEQREDGLWLREDYWPPKREKVFSGGRPPSLTPAQQEQAIMLIRQGMPLQKVAELFNTSYEVIRRLAKSQEVEFRRNGKKLTVEQLEEAFGLLSADIPLREVAEQFGINHESLRQLAQRNGVEVRPRGQKLSPTLRVLTAEQRQEVIDLLSSGVPLRQVAKQFGINRYSLRRLVERDEE